jgi:phospholipid/cholesterol/gamma-HCH transport system ATP-binding protein
MRDALAPRQRDGGPRGPLFEVRELRKSYRGKTVIAGLDLNVERGESLVILGRSGSGKSVTLRLLVGLEPPDSGSIRLDGDEIVGLPEEKLLPVRKRVAMLFQGGALFDSMSVRDNLAFPLREHGERDESRIDERVRELLAKVRLEGIEKKFPADLSGGMKKRVALARALALDPEGVLYDEPTTGLDPMTSASIARLIRETQARENATSVIVTHDLALTRAVADRIAFLDEGRFRFLGTLAEAERSSDSLLLHFLAGKEDESDVPETDSRP